MIKWRKDIRKRLIMAFAVAVAVFCLVLTLGQLVPRLGLPSWEKLFVSAGMRAPTTIPEGELQVHFIDVGNADCILIRQGDVTALIDAGERGDADAVLDYLREHGVKKLDLVVATHPHADHIGSMTAVLDALPTDKMLMAFMPEKATPTTATYLNLLTTIDEKGITLDEAKPGAVYPLGTANLMVLAPLSDSDEANNMSVVTRLTFGERSFLFTGDAEIPVEKELLSSGRAVTADVLKVGHHGSDTCTSSAFLAAVRPTFAVITCGQGNSYGHPHKEVIERLTARQVSVYRADVHGHIVFTSDGKSLTVTAQK